MKYKILILVLLLCFATGCSRDLESRLTGLWKYNDTYIKFNGDGTAFYTRFVDALPKELTILSDKGIMIDDIVFTVEFKKGCLYLNDQKMEKVDTSEEFDNYLNNESSEDNYIDVIDYSLLNTSLEEIGYLNYINEYYKFENIPILDTNFVSDEEKINLVCKIVNKYDGHLQMNETNCLLSD